MLDVMSRRALRLSIQVARRGLFMPMENLQEIVRMRLMRQLFVFWKRRRKYGPANASEAAG